MCSKRKLRVLIVEDSRVMSQRLVDLLGEMKKIQVVGTSETSPEAIRAVKRLKPDVLILDIRLKEGSGFEVLEEIKSNRLDTAVIVYTNYPYSQYRDKCRQLGVRHFLKKENGYEKIPGALGKFLHCCE